MQSFNLYPKTNLQLNLLLFTLACCLLSCNNNPKEKEQPTFETVKQELKIDVQKIELPFSGAWMYMADDQGYDSIPSYWSSIDFNKVDVLYVGPGGVQADGTFGLFSSPETGPLSNRFDWILKTARSQNPDIKILISQWWGNGDGKWGSALSNLTTEAQVATYTNSLVAFLQKYINVYGGVDGYDIDYEDNNAVPNISAITSQIRSKMDSLSGLYYQRPFYLTISPATTYNLDNTVAASLDFVNIQTYAGGTGLGPNNFTVFGLETQQLLYGMCPETGCGGPTIQEAIAHYKTDQLAGIHLWRLNSGNYVYENQVQDSIYMLLHPN